MTRVLSGVVLAAAALAAILFLPPIPLRVVMCLVAALAAHEYLRIVGGDSSYIGGVIIVAWLIATGNPTAPAAAAIVTLFIAGLSALFARRTGQQAIASAFSLIYVGMPLGMLAAVNEMLTWRATILLIATVVVSDSLQYYSGRAFGRHALAPAISPKKTIEGAIGGVVAGTLFMTFAGPLVFPSHPPLALAALGLVIVLLGIAGDLFESRLKRDAQVKDSSSLIPGHGGVLDRIDALLFVTPAFFVYVGGIR